MFIDLGIVGEMPKLGIDMDGLGFDEFVLGINLQG